MNDNPLPRDDVRTMPDVSSLRITRHGLMIMTGPNEGARVIFANAHFEALTGYPSTEIAGGDPLFFLAPEEDERAQERLRAALATGQSASAVVHGVAKNGRPLRFALEVDPIRDAYGAVTHFVATVEDVARLRVG